MADHAMNQKKYLETKARWLCIELEVTPHAFTTGDFRGQNFNNKIYYQWRIQDFPEESVQTPDARAGMRAVVILADYPPTLFGTSQTVLIVVSGTHFFINVNFFANK